MRSSSAGTADWLATRAAGRARAPAAQRNSDFRVKRGGRLLTLVAKGLGEMQTPKGAPRDVYDRQVFLMGYGAAFTVVCASDATTVTVTDIGPSLVSAVSAPKRRDQVLACDGKPIRTAQDLLEGLLLKPYGRIVKLGVSRNGRRLAVNLERSNVNVGPVMQSWLRWHP